jgi:hypothetical protein
MFIKKVEVEFMFENVIKASENMQGILFGNKVFLNDSECGPSLYTAVITDNADKVLVNLDVDSVDYLQENPDLLFELLAS